MLYPERELRNVLSPDGRERITKLRLTQVCLCSFLHLSEDHGADFLWVERLLLTLRHDFDDWLVARTSLDLEWPELDVSLADWVRKLAPNETLGVEHRVLRITGNLVLGCVTNQPLSVSEGDVGRGCTISLVIGNDLNTVVL